MGAAGGPRRLCPLQCTDRAAAAVCYYSKHCLILNSVYLLLNSANSVVFLPSFSVVSLLLCCLFTSCSLYKLVLSFFPPYFLLFFFCLIGNLKACLLFPPSLPCCASSSFSSSFSICLLCCFRSSQCLSVLRRFLSLLGLRGELGLRG